MTAQFPDNFLLNDTEYAIAGIHGQIPFDPQQLDLAPVSPCTACWRGYIATYGIQEDRLVLYKLSIHLGHREQGSSFTPAIGPVINGCTPIQPTQPMAMFNNIYDQLMLPLPFTGGLLIARDFIRDLYVHMGFHPAWKFNEVWELIFDQGLLKSAEDVSDKMADLRNKLSRNPGTPPTGKDHLKWINDAFRLDY